jgi:hypothetical protein
MDSSMPLFGNVALKLEYLSGDQLSHALDVQNQEDRSARPHRLVGMICQDLGYLSLDQARTVWGCQLTEPTRGE